MKLTVRIYLTTDVFRVDSNPSPLAREFDASATVPLYYINIAWEFKLLFLIGRKKRRLKNMFSLSSYVADSQASKIVTPQSNQIDVHDA